MLNHFYIYVFVSLFSAFELSWGVNPFEAGLARVVCFTPRKDVQGSKKSIPEAYPKYSRSFSNATLADTEFWLFTSQNPVEPECLHCFGAKLPNNTYFNENDPTVVIIAGFLDGPCLTYWQIEIKEAFLKRGGWNIIIMSWTWGNQLDYAVSVLNLNIACTHVALLLRNIMEQKDYPAEKFHLLGHSLGAQCCGIAGYKFNRLTKLKVGMIFALDPSGPAFFDVPLKKMLDPTDADCVLAIHANGGHCLPALGRLDSVANVDFFPNGGSVQPSCFIYIFVQLLKQQYRYAIETMIPDFCFHYQSIQYFKVSINPECQFVGIECPSYDDFSDGKCNSCNDDGSNCAVMGLDFLDYSKDKCQKVGVRYYLDTTLLCPYCDTKKIKNTKMFQPSK